MRTENNNRLFIMFVFILSGMYIYSFNNSAATFILTAVSSALMAYYFIKSETPEEQNVADVMVRTMLFYSLAVFVVHFINITVYPGDFIADERNEIVEAYNRLQGEKGLFSYSKRFGASLLYTSTAVVMLFLAVFKENLDMLRLIPAGITGCTAVIVYLMGNEIKDKKTGIAFLFAYAVSGWSFYLARMRLEHVFVPFFVFLVLLFFFKMVKKPSLLKLSAVCAACFFGIFTYASFVLMLPLFMYMFFEYRKEAGTKITAAGITSMAVIGAIFLAINLINGETIQWAAAQTVVGAAEAKTGLLQRFVNVFELFVKPVSTSNAFIKNSPILSFPELILLASGLVLMISKFKDRLNRVMLAGFFIAVLTVISGKSIDHHWRHILVLPFIIIISGTFIEYAMNKKGFYLIVLVSILAGINTGFFYFTGYGIQNNNPAVYKEISAKINLLSGGKDCVVLHEPFPYGQYTVYLRTKSAYQKRLKNGKVFIIIPALWKKQTDKLFPGSKVYYFYDTKAPATRVIALVEYQPETPEEYSEFISVKKQLAKAVMHMWDLNYDKVLNIQPSESTSPAVSFMNAVMYVKAAEANFVLNKK
ncbi:MAG: hypothetical protein CVV21_04270 [Candidatus Goldiibacteriota bacterium HGW-Goldbacteria-1]|jgi:4-amino-4-deoxy-L-arabinose transferase-like glycosyltransferase|nr:MAG: hypothetical protein CVV21_04270 [Candidatus Goldiibacteriota bacterium HGW-Goldbacteria-1]